MDVIQIFNNNAFANRDGHTPRWIILHGTAGGTSAQAIASYFKSTEGGANPVSSHYVIGQDGTIVACVSEANGAWANGAISVGHDPWWNTNINPNNLTISIEHCKPHDDNSDALTTPQQASSFALIADICARTGIPARMADASGGITGHFSLDPVNRSRCPGAYPWSNLWPFLKGGSPVGVPSGWKDDGVTLTASNGVPIVRGFRDHVLKSPSWNPGNVPQAAELPAKPVQYHNPALGGGTIQPFRDFIMWWTSSKGVVEEQYSGLEIWACYQKIASMEHQSISPVQGIADAVLTLKSVDTIIVGAIKKLSS